MKIGATLDEVRKVGSTVWIFDANHRVYRKGPDGRSLGGGPIWREHWVKREIRAETSRSWVIGEHWSERKIAKKGEQPWDVCWSEQEITERAYVHDNAPRIADLVTRLRDYDTLKKIAELIDYVEKS
jgi:hypothetical protein